MQENSISKKQKSIKTKEIISNMYYDKLMEKVARDRKSLAQSYNTDESKVVYIGDNHYIVITKDTQEIRI